MHLLESSASPLRFEAYVKEPVGVVGHAGRRILLNLPCSLACKAWRMITWRKNGEAFTSRFTRLRVRRVTRAGQPAEEWLLIE